jgi:uncharacterized RDD family membrane protein YckC
MLKKNESKFGYMMIMFIISVFVEGYLITAYNGYWVDGDDLYSILSWALNRDNYLIGALLFGVVVVFELIYMIFLSGEKEKTIEKKNRLSYRT